MMSSSREGRFIIHKKWDGPYQIGRVVVAKVDVEGADEKGLILSRPVSSVYLLERTN